MPAHLTIFADTTSAECVHIPLGHRDRSAIRLSDGDDSVSIVGSPDDLRALAARLLSAAGSKPDLGRCFPDYRNAKLRVLHRETTQPAAVR